jgi:hypothetical protein
VARAREASAVIADPRWQTISRTSSK